jgi:hypothetical protein
MKRSVRLVLGWLSLVGGALGLAGGVFALFATSRLDPSSAFFLAFMLGFFVLGAYAGYAALREAGPWQALLVMFWVAQLPLVSLPVFSYFSSAGLGARLFATTEPRLGADYYIGSQVGFTAGSPGPAGEHFAFGINVVAALAAFVAAQGMRRRRAV